MYVCTLGLAVAAAAALLLPAMMVDAARAEDMPSAQAYINGAGDVWFRDPYAVAVAPDGRIVVVDTGYYRSGDAARIQVFNPDGTPALALGLADTLGEEIRAPFGVAVAPDGRIIVATNVNYSGSYRIHALHPNGTLDHAFGSYGGSGLTTESHGVAVAPDGRIVVTAGSRMHIHHPNGTLDRDFWVHDATNGVLYLRDAVVAPDGRIIVVDDDVRQHHAYSLYVVNLNGTFVPDYGLYNGTFALDRGLYNGTEGVGYLSGVAVAPDGRIAVLEEWNERIHILHPNGTLDHAFGSYGVGPGQFDRPRDVAVAPDGRIVVADYGNDRVQVLHPNGTLALVLGSEVVVDGGFYGYPGIAVAPDGRIVVADYGNDRVQVLHPNGTLDHAFGSYGVGPGQFYRPHDVAVAPDGRIAVWDGEYGSARIQVLHPNGTLALVLGPEFNADGGFYPSDSAVAPDGRIVVAATVYSNNYSNADHRILTFHPNGTLDEASWLYGTGNETLELRDIAVAPDGRIVAAVNVYNSSTHHADSRILTFRPNGTLDHAVSVHDLLYQTWVISPGLYEIAVAPDGRIVTADNALGSHNHRIQVLHPNGTLALVLGPEFNADGGFYSLSRIVVAPDGRIVVAAGVDSYSDYRILTFHPNGTLDGDFEVYGAYNEPIFELHSIAVAPDGRIVVGGLSDGDVDRGRILTFHPNGTLALVLGSKGPDRFIGITDLAIAPDGRIVVADGDYSRIHVFNPDGTRALGIGQYGDKLGQFSGLAGIAVAPDGRIVVADGANRWDDYDRIQTFNPDGTLDEAFKIFTKPFGVAVAPDGQIMVSIAGSTSGYPDNIPFDYRINVFHPNGTFSRVFGSAPSWPVSFDSPSVAVAPDGRIVAPSPNRGYIQVFYPYGTPASSIGVYGQGPPGQLYGPADAAVAPDGRIVVADTGNHRVQVFYPNGTLDHAFGSHGTGPGQFNRPTDVAVAPDGRIVVADTGVAPSFTTYARTEHRIQVFYPNGTLALVLGPYGVIDEVFHDLHDPAARSVPPAVVDPAPVVVVEQDGSGGLRNYTNVGDAANLTIDVAGLVAPAPPPAPGGSEPRMVVFPPRETVVITSFAEVSFPPGVTASHVPADGLLVLRISAEALSDELVQRALTHAGSGRVVPQRIVEVGGSGDEGGSGRVTFDQPIRILLEGQAGGRAFYIQGEDGKIMPIDAACAVDDTVRVHRQLTGVGECWVNSADGNDKIIYTYHLTRFGTVLSESGAPPPVVQTCSVRLGTPNLDVSASFGEQSPPVQQALINSGSLPFAGVELETTPWYVDWDGSAPPAAGHPSLPASISEVLFKDVDFGHVATAINGTVVARGLGGGDVAPLSFVADLTPYDEVQGSALVQYVTYLAQCGL